LWFWGDFVTRREEQDGVGSLISPRQPATDEVSMICLRAAVRSEGSPAGHAGTHKSPEYPLPQWVVIEESPEGFLLIHVYLREGAFIHTWHPSVQEAKEEARREFAIGVDEWAPVHEEVSME